MKQDGHDEHCMNSPIKQDSIEGSEAIAESTRAEHNAIDYDNYYVNQVIEQKFDARVMY